MLANFNAMPMPYWLCFGTLLHETRALTGEHVFKIPQEKFWGKVVDDIDLGVFYDNYHFQYIKNFCSGAGWEIDHTIRPDTGGQPLYVSLKPTKDVESITGEVCLDVFAWYEFKDMYWHTFDTRMERPHKGIPDKYVFRGVPKWVFKDFVGIDNVAGSGMNAKIPLRYGTLFDWWYTDWIKPRPQATSNALWEIQFKSFKDLAKNKYEIVSWLNE